ncbi:MAG: hypothetical protein ACREDD_11960 [Methylocella sp.]
MTGQRPRFLVNSWERALLDAGQAFALERSAPAPRVLDLPALP